MKTEQNARFTFRLISDSKNDKRVTAGTYTIKEIYLLDKDYDETYEFKHNDKLLVFPDEKVFFDIEVIEVKESQAESVTKRRERHRRSRSD